MHSKAGKRRPLPPPPPRDGAAREERSWRSKRSPSKKGRYTRHMQGLASHPIAASNTPRKHTCSSSKPLPPQQSSRTPHPHPSPPEKHTRSQSFPALQPGVPISQHHAPSFPYPPPPPPHAPSPSPSLTPSPSPPIRSNPRFCTRQLTEPGEGRRVVWLPTRALLKPPSSPPVRLPRGRVGFDRDSVA